MWGVGDETTNLARRGLKGGCVVYGGELYDSVTTWAEPGKVVGVVETPAEAG